MFPESVLGIGSDCPSFQNITNPSLLDLVIMLGLFFFFFFAPSPRTSSTETLKRYPVCFRADSSMVLNECGLNAIISFTRDYRESTVLSFDL